MNDNPNYIVKLLTANGQVFYVNSFKELRGEVDTIFIISDIKRAKKFEKRSAAEDIGKLRKEQDEESGKELALRVLDFEIITL